MICKLRIIERMECCVASGAILPMSNERHVAKVWRNCCLIYVATSRARVPWPREPIRDHSCIDRHEVTRLPHDYKCVDEMSRPQQMLEGSPPHGGKE